MREDWLRGFRKRWPRVTLRTPENTSFARANAFTKEKITDFYDKLGKTIRENNIKPEDIWNMDETPVGTVPKETNRVLAWKGSRQVGGLVAAERGERVTATICCSAVGEYMSPLMILPCKNVNQELIQGAPEGTMVEFDKSGYIQTDIFFRWINSFKKVAKPNENKKVLLTLDGHTSHSKNLRAIRFAIENNIIMFLLPPHCSHKVQPVDLTFNKSLSNHMTIESNSWTRLHKKERKVLTLKNLFEVSTPAYLKAATVQNAVNGFKKAGIHPFNQNNFKDEDFAGAINLTPDGMLAFYKLFIFSIVKPSVI